jgi:hypothetical protein
MPKPMCNARSLSRTSPAAVQRALVDRQAGKAVLLEHLDQFVLADVHGDGGDLDLGDCHVIHAQAAQVADTRQAVGLRDDGRGARFGGFGRGSRN